MIDAFKQERKLWKQRRAKKKFKLYIFRVCSSRGTDFRSGFKLRPDITDKEALELAKEWAEQQTSNTACQEYTVTVYQIKHIPRREWLKKWSAICKKHQEISDKKSDLYAMNMAADWTQQ